MSRHVREKLAAGRVDAVPYKNTPRGSGGPPEDGCLLSHQMGHCCCKQDGLSSCSFERLPSGVWQRQAGVVSCTSRAFGGAEHIVKRVGGAVDSTALCGAVVPSDAVYWMKGEPLPHCLGCSAAMETLAKD